jgi:hypothetical protein
MGALDELSSRGLIDWSRAVAMAWLCRYATVNCAIGCGGCLWVPNRSSIRGNLGKFVDQSAEPDVASKAKTRW